MKRLMAILVVLSVAACAVIAYAADEQTQDEQKPARTRQGRPGAERGRPDASELEAQRPMRGRGPIDDPAARGRGPEDRPMQNMQQLQKKQLEELVKELEAVKKIAEEEKATKTVEAIQQLIDKKNAEFKNRQAEMEKRRAEMMERMRQRQEQGPPAGTEGQQLQPGPKAKGAEKKAGKNK